MTPDLLTRNVARRRLDFGVVQHGTELLPGVPVAPAPTLPAVVVWTRRDPVPVLTRNLARRALAFGTTLEGRAGTVASITRPVKSGGNTEYVDEVAIGYDLIRDNEVDADLDVVYAGHNALVGAFNEFLAGSAALWRADTEWGYITPDPSTTVVLDHAYPLRWVDIATDPGGANAAYIAGVGGSLTISTALPTSRIDLLAAGTLQMSVQPDRLFLQGGVVVGPDIQATPENGTLQFTGTKFQGRVAGAWVDIPGSGAAGPAGGDLTGTYPDPSIGALKVTRAKIAADAWLSPVPAGADVGKVLTVAAGPTLSWATAGGGSSGWSDDATNKYLKPTTTDRGVAVAQGGAQGRSPVQFGNRTIKGRLLASGTDDTLGVSINCSLNANDVFFTVDDASRPSWVQWFKANAGGGVNDGIVWTHGAAGSSPTSEFMRLDGAGKLTVPGGSPGDAFQVGLRVPKGRINAAAGADAVQFTMNRRYDGLRDDTAKPSWSLLLGVDTDKVIIEHADAAGTFRQPFVLDGAGKLTLPGATANPVQWGSRTAKGRLISPTLADAATFTFNRTLDAPETGWVRDDTTKAAWALQFNGGSDALFVSRIPAAGGADAILLTLSNFGSITIPATHVFNTMNPVQGYIGGYGTTAIRLGVNDRYAPPVPTAASWEFDLDTAGVGAMTLVYRAANAAAGSSLHSLNFDGNGNLAISGAIGQKTSGTTWSNPSDPRLKRDMAPYTTGLQAILALEPISFFYNGKGGTTDDGRQCYGYDASAVQTVMPECVGLRRGKLDPDDTDETEILTLDTSNFTLALINAVKELTARVAALEASA